jgi:hypothetical protein
MGVLHTVAVSRVSKHIFRLNYIFLNFRTSEQPQWFVGEEAIVSYTLDTGAGLYLDTWDWIGLYKVSRIVSKEFWRETWTAASLSDDSVNHSNCG